MENSFVSSPSQGMKVTEVGVVNILGYKLGIPDLDPDYKEMLGKNFSFLILALASSSVK